jgi:hypothetical protein
MPYVLRAKNHWEPSFSALVICIQLGLLATFGEARPERFLQRPTWAWIIALEATTAPGQAHLHGRGRING